LCSLKETETADLLEKIYPYKINRLFDADSTQNPIMEQLQRTLLTVQEMNAEGQRLALNFF